MTQTKIAVIGAGGRMGQEVIQLAQEMPLVEFVCGVDAGAIEYLDNFNEIDPSAVNVLIDFSSPSLLHGLAEWCSLHKVCLVSGTTGLQEKDFLALNQAAQKIPVLWAPNMSLGIAFMAEILTQFSKISEEFDFQIEESHHINKKDAPSGTAIFLQETLEASISRKIPPALSIRGGGIFGIHKAWAMSKEETLTIEHTALNRTVFARGALKAACWLVDQGPGRYEIRDVLNKR